MHVLAVAVVDLVPVVGLVVGLESEWIELSVYEVEEEVVCSQ